MRFIGEQTALFERTGTPFCVALIDVDLFKRVNEEHGHLIGDKALTTLAQIADAMTRASDCFGRYGGEEFIALFAATRMAQARVSLERIRAGIEAHDWTGVAPGLAITVTCGVAQFARGDSIESIIRRADEALYAGKNAGRNRVVGERADGGAAAENRADPERLMRV
jgi:diguanylate cyclase (GGDEF)-like protein